ncbi:MAG: radical SAM protein, partial [Planctomycetota bacterium]
MEPTVPQIDPAKIERLMRHHATRTTLRLLTRPDHTGRCTMDRIMDRYGADDLTLREKLLYAIPFKLIDYIREKAGASREGVQREVFHHLARHRAIINTLRGIARFGLVKPQTFDAPLMVVWNFTQACNFKCQHCYQHASKPLPDELSWPEKRAVVDELVRNNVPLIAFSGGEPMMGPHFWETVDYAGRHGLNMNLATNGSLLTPEAVDRLARSGVRYVEVSVDSVVPEKHDAFRGIEGYWQRSIEGIKNVAADARMKVGLASTITSDNIDELDELIELAISLDCDTFFAFNFIPTGRARDIMAKDITPQQREGMLRRLHHHLEEGRINIVSSAPQLGRACLQYAAGDGLINTGHYGAAQGERARTLARYVGGCGAGRCYVALQPNGKVTPCVFMPIEVGDLRTQGLQQVWTDSEVMHKLRRRDHLGGTCGSCDYKLYCGGCRARAFGYTGDITEADPGC